VPPRGRRVRVAGQLLDGREGVSSWSMERVLEERLASLQVAPQSLTSTLPCLLNLLMGHDGVLSLVELKEDSKMLSRRKVTAAEQTTIERFGAVGCPVLMTATIEELLRARGDGVRLFGPSCISHLWYTAPCPHVVSPAIRRV